MPEGHGVLDFPVGIEFAFAALDVHVVRHDNCQRFAM
jgi:hypothetical protein